MSVCFTFLTILLPRQKASTDGRTRLTCRDYSRLRGNAGPDKRLHPWGGHGPGHQEALPVPAAHLPQRGELTGLLDAFGDNLHAQLPADLDHGPGEQGQGVIPAQAVHEGRVDLDDVRGQLAQVGQRRVPGAEVIDGEPYTQVTQRGQAVHDQPRVLHQDPLVHLDGERGGRQVMLSQQLAYDRQERRSGDLPPGGVDRDRDVPACPAPGGGLSAGLPQHPLPQAHYQAGFLGSPEELLRWHLLPGAPPAHQRLGSDHPGRRQVHHRLVLERELVVRDRLLQVADQLDATDRVRVHVLLVYLDPVPALVL